MLKYSNRTKTLEFLQGRNESEGHIRKSPPLTFNCAMRIPSETGNRGLHSNNCEVELYLRHLSATRAERRMTVENTFLLQSRPHSEEIFPRESSLCKSEHRVSDTQFFKGILSFPRALQDGTYLENKGEGASKWGPEPR